MLDGSHSMIDFPFKINGEDFNQLYYLVDGIYPWLKRFLCTIPDPVTTVDRLLSKSQESWRKSIERAFGVWKKKYLVVKHPMEMHDRHDIFYVVNATILLHNMMVEVRMGQGELESSEFYITEDLLFSENEGESKVTGAECGEVETSECESFRKNKEKDENFLKLKYSITQKRWKELYDAQAALKLQDAVKKELYSERYDNVNYGSYLVAQDFDPLKY